LELVDEEGAEVAAARSFIHRVNQASADSSCDLIGGSSEGLDPRYR
jgi:hypothetical protein